MTSFREYRERMARGDAPVAEDVTLPREARPFQGMRAGIVTRVAANSVDFLIMLLALGVGYASWAALVFLLDPAGFSWPTAPWGVFFVAGFIWMVLYFAISWGWTGRTYGDYLMGLRVVNFRGERPRWVGAFMRAWFCVGVPIGLFWVVISRQNRSIQDVVLRTSVIYDWAVTVHDAEHAQALAAAMGAATSPEGQNPSVDDRDSEIPRTQ